MRWMQESKFFYYPYQLQTLQTRALLVIQHISRKMHQRRLS